LARDVVQDVFARLCREPPADLNGRLTPWLYAACRNRAIDLRRKDSRVTFAADAAVFAIAGLSRGLKPARSKESPASRGLQSSRSSGAKDESHSAIDPASHAATRDETAKVLRMLGELPSSQQEAVCLRFSCGLSYKEIAAVMELSVSHVGVLLHTAITALRERMSG
jgi:RNA polymerase sigma-70 factor (ECF subfamily)